DPPSTAPLLPGRGNREWRDLNERCQAALRAREFELADKLALQMTALDGGTNAVPLRILAENCRLRGDLEGARQYLEDGRDAESWDPSFSFSPRASSTVQRALREAATGYNNVVVDVPAVFKQHLGNALPDRRIFLDYCHHTAEGINVVMAQVASNAVSL